MSIESTFFTTLASFCIKCISIKVNEVMTMHVFELKSIVHSIHY